MYMTLGCSVLEDELTVCLETLKGSFEVTTQCFNNHPMSSAELHTEL